MSLLSRAFGVRPHRAQAVGVRRDLVIPAGDGVPLLANRLIRWTSTGPRWCCSAAGRADGRSMSRTESCASPTPHRTPRSPSSWICRLSPTRSGAVIGSGCRSPVAPIPATDAISAPQSHSPPAHAYRPATARCSTMPSTRPQCGYPCTADLQWSLPPSLSAQMVDPISRAARTSAGSVGNSPPPENNRSRTEGVDTITLRLRSGIALRDEQAARRPVAAPAVDGRHGWPR